MIKTVGDQKGIYAISFFGPSVLAAFSGREYDRTRRADFLKELGLAPESLVLLKQVHSANIVWVKGGEKPDRSCQADGMITRSPGVALGVLTADCVPVFFWDSEQRVGGLAHAGWRGMSQQIVPKMVQAMRQNFGSKGESILAAFGPAIRVCCYEVGEEFREYFPKFYVAPKKGALKGHMDLIAAVTEQLLEEGLSHENLFDSAYCSACRNDRFFSARREAGTAERMLSVIQIRES